MHLGFGEISVVLVIALLVFGPSKLPQLGEALGKGIRNFKKAFDEEPTHVPPGEGGQLQLPTASARLTQPSQKTEFRKE